MLHHAVFLQVRHEQLSEKAVVLLDERSHLARLLKELVLAFAFQHTVHRAAVAPAGIYRLFAGGYGAVLPVRNEVKTAVFVASGTPRALGQHINQRVHVLLVNDLKLVQHIRHRTAECRALFVANVGRVERGYVLRYGGISPDRSRAHH